MIRRGFYRSHSLSGASRPAEIDAAGRQEARRMGDPQRRGMADRERDAAHRAEPADGPAAVAGCAELVLARIRHARRLLAAVQGADRPQHAGDPGAERQRLQLLPARRFGRARGRLRIHGARICPGPDAQAGQPGRCDQARGRHHREIHRQAAALVGKSGPDGNRGDHRPVAPQRHRISGRLGDRRSAAGYRDARTAS